MKKILYILISYFSFFISHNVFAEGGILGVENQKLRNGEIHTDDIPAIITHATDWIMGFAATISIIFIIVGAYQIAIGSISNDKSKGKTTILMALTGFAVSALAWVIIRLVIDNFG